MIYQWIILALLIGYIAFTYIKKYPLKTRLLPITALLIISILLQLVPVFIIKLIGLFLLEKLWIILSSVLFIESGMNKRKRFLMIILGALSLIIYFYLRTMI